eukprot:Skav225325  [mRNA]  locus=scaffold891:269881:270801:+ [translate_table: standard]
MVILRAVSGRALYELEEHHPVAGRTLIRAFCHGPSSDTPSPQCVSLLDEYTSRIIDNEELLYDTDVVTAVIHSHNLYDARAIRLLCQAVEYGRISEIESGLWAKIDPDHTYLGNSPLEVALKNTHPHEHEPTGVIVELLLTAKASPQATEIPGSRSLLHHLVRSCMPDTEAGDILRMLYEYGATIDHRDGNSYTALHITAYYGQVALASILLQYGANINLATEPSRPSVTYIGDFQQPYRQLWYGGETALVYASARGHVRMVCLLLEHAADPHIVDSRGRTWVQVATGDLFTLATAFSCTAVGARG